MMRPRPFCAVVHALDRQESIPNAATLPVEDLINQVLPHLDKSFIGTTSYNVEGKTRKPVLKAIATNTFDACRSCSSDIAALLLEHFVACGPGRRL